MDIQGLSARFEQLFGTQPVIIRSPGRVNLIGEHTDYNGGFVLPAAVDKAIYLAIQKRTDSALNMHAAEFNETWSSDIHQLSPVPGKWVNYLTGVAQQYYIKGLLQYGCDVLIDGNIPIGAGLSSSAAVECAMAFGLNRLFGWNCPTMDMVLSAQQAEHQFAKVNCGIMDMFASMYGKKEHAIRLDCRSFEFEYIPIRLGGRRIVLMDTGVKHSLASSAYNTRREECEEGVRLLQADHPEVQSLRDATVAMLEKIRSSHPVVYRRCRYVVEENARLLGACDDLVRNDISAFGEKMFRTHEGLSREYEVSCAELDFLVEAVKKYPAVEGARMMGGGFGGCTINLIKNEAIDDISGKMKAAYSGAFGKELKIYIASIEDGTREITDAR